MNQIVLDYAERKNLLEDKAVMLIIKPLKVKNIKNISDHFIDWKPGLSRLAIKRH